MCGSHDCAVGTIGLLDFRLDDGRFGTQLPLAVMQVDVSYRMLSGHSEDVGDCGF